MAPVCALCRAYQRVEICIRQCSRDVISNSLKWLRHRPWLWGSKVSEIERSVRASMLPYLFRLAHAHPELFLFTSIHTEPIPHQLAAAISYDQVRDTFSETFLAFRAVFLIFFASAGGQHLETTRAEANRECFATSNEKKRASKSEKPFKRLGIWENGAHS